MALVGKAIDVFTFETESLLYVLVENPGIVRAFGPEPPISNVPLTVGALTEQSFGLDWRTLVDLAETRTPFMSSLGELSVSPLRNDASDVTNVLVRVGGSRRLSTVPPSSNTRPLSIELVRGRDPNAGRAVELAERISATGLPVYVAGARGAGADAVALHLAAKSRSCAGPLTRVRARSPELFLPPCAEGGILLVEQFHELDAEAGDHLAGELAEGMYASWQLIACGRDDLQSRVQQKTFSAQLAALVRSSTVTMPTLRERDDLEFLVGALLRMMPSAAGTQFDVTPSAMRTLGAYAWPDNLLELRSALTRACATAVNGPIREVDLPSDRGTLNSPPQGGMRRAAERAALSEALRVSGGNVSVAARELGVARSTLYRLLERHGLHKT